MVDNQQRQVQELTADNQQLKQTYGASVTPLAGFWERFGASMIDAVILNIIAVLLLGALFLVRMLVAPTKEPGTVEVVIYYLYLFGIFVLLPWLYSAIMTSSRHQATVGKRLIGLVVTDLSGRRISFGRATVRYFAKLLSAFICYIGFLMIAFTPKKQGLHDYIASTLVLTKEKHPN